MVIIIICIMGVFYFVDFHQEEIIDVKSPEIISIQKELDSLLVIRKEEGIPKIYPFNPNFITDYKGYTLGMSVEEIDRLLAYRKKDKWINSKEDFQKVTLVSDSILAKISPYFKFPEWVTNPKPDKKTFKPKKEKSYKAKIDLNHASEDELQKIFGVGPTLSNRIVSYREMIGGFSNDIQLYTIYGLKDEVIENILIDFTVKTPKEILKMNLNDVSASDLATIPGISFDLAKSIWEYRILNEGIENFSELEKIEGMSSRKLQVFQLYLNLD